MNAQNSVFRGNVIRQETGESLVFALVELSPVMKATMTDEEGFFSFDQLPAGTYTLHISYLGLESLEFNFELEQNEITYEKIALKETGLQLSVVDISARNQVRKNELRISQLSIDRSSLSNFPSISGTADLAEYLSFIPGVANTGDQGGQLFFRGGSATQNDILLDGLTIVQPFHSLGYFSVFDSDFIRSAEVFTAAFQSEYGSRTSASVDVRTRDGNDNRFGGYLSANPFYVKAAFEGPLVKRRERSGSTSFLLTTKHSIIDRTSKSIYKHASVNDSVGLPFHFRDSFGKLTHTAENGSKFSLMGFNFIDSFNDPGSASIDWETYGGALNFQLIPGFSTTIIHGIIGYSNYQSSILDGTGRPRESGLKSFNVSLNFKNYRDLFEWNYGFGLDLIRTDFQFTNPFSLIISQFQSTTELQAYIGFKSRFAGWILELGSRMQYYASTSEPSFEPRFGIKYKISDKFRLKSGGGLYSQNLLGASNERDVINLFVGFLTGPEFRISNIEGIELESSVQKSKHIVFGMEWDIFPSVFLSAEVYRKEFDPLLVLNRNKLSTAESDFAVENSVAEGIDLELKIAHSLVDIIAGYSLSRVNRNDGFQVYPPHFDRRHNLNLLFSRDFGRDQNYSFNLRWNFASGFPFTQTLGFYNLNQFFAGTLTPYLTDNPAFPGILFSPHRNSARLPYYHRLDISLARTFSLKGYSNLKLSMSVTNSYDRNNIFYFDRINYRRIDQLPIIPSLDIKWKF